MWQMQGDWYELVIRAVVIYSCLFILLRLLGKKQLGEMSPFDFVLLLIVSESISNGLTGDDHTITGGLISATTLLALTGFVDCLAYKSKRIERIIEGTPEFIVRDGKILEEVKRNMKITDNELMETVRSRGIERIEDVKFAIVETNGTISVIKAE